jgi:hypothetical protein
MEKIRLVDETVQEITRIDKVNGRVEIDIQDKTSEEIEALFAVPARLVTIELLTSENEKYGELSGYTVLDGVMLKGGVKTVLLSKAVDVTEERLVAAESYALKAMVIAEDLKNNGIPYEQNEVLSASVIVARASAQTLNDADSLKVKAIYSNWEELVFEGYVATTPGFKFTHEGNLYKTIHENQRFQADWIPGQGTESIFTRIDEAHTGTLDDPIPASVNMEYVKGQYYLENSRVYLMNREGMEDGEGIVLQFLPSSLVEQYFELVASDAV